MRLICPNCAAQYDVSDGAIPPEGRDVQCSNCQESWFQTEASVVSGRDMPKRITPTLPNAVEVTNSAKNEISDDNDVSDQVAIPRKGLDSEVANILRQEASREGALPGDQKSAPPATQVEKPIEPVDADQTRLRVAKMTVDEGGTTAGRGAVAAAAIGAVSATNVRSIPSINEINAALRTRAEVRDTSGLPENEKQEAVQRSGFRRGFTFILLLIAILILPYIVADQIAENLPQAREFMASYVTTIDQMRLWLNELVSRFTSG